MTAYLSLASPILKGVMVCLVAGLSLLCGAYRLSKWRLPVWRPWPAIPSIPRIVANWDPVISTKLLHGTVLTLVLVGETLVGFEAACLKCSHRLGRWFLDSPQAVRDFWRSKTRSRF